MEKRICTTCGQELPLSDFYKNGVDKDGKLRRRNDCKTCYNIKKKISKKTHSKFKSNTKVRDTGAAVLTLEEWKEILIHWRGTCAYCGRKPAKRGERLTKEHVMPVSKHGVSTKYNIIPACTRCNCSKSDRELDEWYPQQSFYSKERYKKIREWCEHGKSFRSED